jgi:zinc protease
MPADRSALPSVGPDPAFVFPSIARHLLANGLSVRLVEHHSAPVVTFALQIAGGAGADPPDKEGLSALTADMVDEGTGSMSAIDVSDALARLGAEYDVEVGADSTVFTLTTLARFAERAGSLLAAIVTAPSLHAGDFERVLQLRVDRLQQLKDLAPAMAERAFLRVLYGDHPYGHLAIGTTRSLRSLAVRDVQSFHAAAYRPSRATLVITGPMLRTELLRIAEAAFGSWTDPAGGGDSLPPAAATVATPTAPAARLVVVPRDGAAQSELRIGHLSARRDTPDYPALLVMNAVLGGQFVSRINLKLREEKGYTYGARTGFDWRLGLAPFVLQASVHTASTSDAIKDSLAELEGIRNSRPSTEQELTLGKASLTRGYPRNFETAQQVGRSVAQLALFGLPDAYFEEFVPKVHATTAEDVTSAAKRYIDPTRLTVLIVGDLQRICDSLDTLGLGEPLVLPVEV